MRSNGGASRVATKAEVEALRSRLFDPGRVHPIVVVSNDSGLDTDAIAHALLHKCDVFEIAAAVRADVVPARWVALTMAGCAARVYPGSGLDWQKRPELSRFFRGNVSTDDVVEAAHAVIPGRAARRQVQQLRAADRAFDRDASHQVVRIQDVSGVRALAKRLLDPSRRAPIALVTVPFGEQDPVINADALLQVAPGEVEVYVLPTREMTFALTHELGREASVFGGAGRVYAPGVGWLHDPSESPLHLVDTSGRAHAATNRMIADVIREVANVRYAEHQRQATAPTARQLQASADLASSLDRYARGSLVLARVMAVDRASARLELFPDVSVELGAEDVTGNPLDRLDDLMTFDEVVVTRVVDRPGRGGDPGMWRLSMLDVDDDESVVEAPPVQRDGKPWISLADNETRALRFSEDRDLQNEQPTRAPSVPTPGPAQLVQLQARVKTLEAERDQLRQEADQWRKDAMAYYAQSNARGQELQELRTRARKTRVRERDHSNRSICFPTAEDEFRWKVFLTWAELIPAGEKPTSPLPRYWIGPQFLESVDALGEQFQRKVLKAVVLVLLGRANDVHRLRSGEAGGAPSVIVNGSHCMRAPIEESTPSARRLHYWQGSSGRIELSRVGVHDDFGSGPAPQFGDSAGGGRYIW